MLPLTALVVCLTGLVVLWRAEPTIARLVAVLERRTAVLERATTPSELPKRPPLPVDLQLLVLSESEGWAREQAVQSLYELFDTHGDWNAVRAVRGQVHG